MRILIADRTFRPAELRMAFFDSPFGHVLIALEPESNCIVWLSLVLDRSEKARKANVDELKHHWAPGILKSGVGNALGKRPGKWIFEKDADLPDLMMKGTDFQHDVWRKLLEIPCGKTASYADLAEQLKRPRSHARAIGSAVAANTIAILVPCHRVVGSGGKLSGFRWGVARKRFLLDWEETSLNKVR